MQKFPQNPPLVRPCEHASSILPCLLCVVVRSPQEIVRHGIQDKAWLKPIGLAGSGVTTHHTSVLQLGILSKGQVGCLGIHWLLPSRPNARFPVSGARRHASECMHALWITTTGLPVDKKKKKSSSGREYLSLHADVDTFKK